MFKTADEMKKDSAMVIYNRADHKTQVIIDFLYEKVETILPTFYSMPWAFDYDHSQSLESISKVSDFDKVSYGMVEEKRIDIVKKFFEILGYVVSTRSDYDPETDTEYVAEIYISYKD